MIIVLAKKSLKNNIKITNFELKDYINSGYTLGRIAEDFDFTLKDLIGNGLLHIIFKYVS